MNKQAQSKLLYSILICLILIGGLFIAKGVYAAYTAPTVTLESPASGDYDTDGNIDFNFTLTDATTDSLLNVSGNATLFLNGIANSTWKGGTAYDITNGTEFNITPKTLANNIYLWNIRITNYTGGVSWWSADNSTIIVDKTAPVAVVRFPANNTYYQTAALEVDVIVNETNPNTCNIYLSTESASTSGISNESKAYSNKTAFNFTTISGFSNGDTIHYNVTCTDSAGNSFTTPSRAAFFDLEDPSIETNITNGSWFAVNNPIVQINYSVRDNYFITNCSLWGDFNDTDDDGGGSGWKLNKTVWNTTQANVSLAKDTDLNFSSLNLYDANRTDMYRYNVQCVSASNRTGWLSINQTFGVDKIAPTAPQVYFISPEYAYTNETSSLRRWYNMTWLITTSDANPYVVWRSVTDENYVTINIVADNDTISSSDTLSTRVFNIPGTTIQNNKSYNYSQISLSPGRTYTTYYIAINATDEAGNVNSSSNQTTMAMKLDYRVSSAGANLTGSVWNPVMVARPSQFNETLATIINETGATYVTIYNKSHEFMTCTSASKASATCKLNASYGTPVWIYTASNTSWRYSWWNYSYLGLPTAKLPVIDSDMVANPGHIINFTTNLTAAGSRWNYLGIINRTGCTFQNLQNILNSTTNNQTGVNWGTNRANVNQTGSNLGTPNITYQSFYNASMRDGIYYPYYWDFGAPWNTTGIGFRDVVGLYLNHTYAATYNRTGC